MKKSKFFMDLFWFSLLLAVFLSSVFLWQFDMVRGADSDDEIREDIENVEKKLEREQAAKQKLEQELGKIQSSVINTQREIEKTEKLLKETQGTIARKELELKLLAERLELQRELLKGLVREVYYKKQAPAVDFVFAKEDFFTDVRGTDALFDLDQKIEFIIQDIQQSHEQIEGEKIKLEDQKEDHEKLLALKEDQEQDLLADKNEVQADIQAKEKTISQLNDKLNTLRSEYSRILGKSISTKDIVEAAEFASKKTGMSKAFLLAVLIQESNKGQSTGSCDYKQSKMSATQLDAFKSICAELKYDYKKQKVSCPPKSYKGTGGAMGVPQFMPTTWQGYKSRIASLSGNNPPDPWSLVDGVVAMASKLSNDGANKKTRFAEAKSYCVYLAGGNWGYYCYGSDKYRKSYEDYNCWGSSIKNYGEKVLCLKDNYEKYY